MKLTELEQAAIELITARDAARAAKTARNSCKCECEEPMTRGEDERDYDPGTPACFMAGIQNDHYCDSCKKREILHQQVAPITKRATRALSTLRRLVHSIQKPKSK